MLSPHDIIQNKHALSFIVDDLIRTSRGNYQHDIFDLIDKSIDDPRILYFNEIIGNDVESVFPNINPVLVTSSLSNYTTKDMLARAYAYRSKQVSVKQFHSPPVYREILRLRSSVREQTFISIFPQSRLSIDFCIILPIQYRVIINEYLIISPRFSTDPYTWHQYSKVTVFTDINAVDVCRYTLLFKTIPISKARANYLAKSKLATLAIDYTNDIVGDIQSSQQLLPDRYAKLFLSN